MIKTCQQGEKAQNRNDKAYQLIEAQNCNKMSNPKVYQTGKGQKLSIQASSTKTHS